MNVREEKWGPFGRDWQCKYYEGHMVEPQFSSLMAIPLAWTESTSGSITGEPMLAVIRTEADMDKYKGKLRGKIVMTAAAQDIFRSQQRPKLTGTPTLNSRPKSRPRIPSRSGLLLDADPVNRGGDAGAPPPLSREARQALQDKIVTFMKDEGVLLTITASGNGSGGTIFAAAGGSYDPKHPVAVPGVALMPEQYNRIARLAGAQDPGQTRVQYPKRAFVEQRRFLQHCGRDPRHGPA